jgi:hypothetical protein
MAVNQGSRGALVTWTVIMTILFVTMTIVAIYSYVEAGNQREAATKLAQQYGDILAEGELSSPDLAALKEARSSAPEGSDINPSMKLMRVAMAQRDALARLISGSATTDPARAQMGATAALTASAEKVKELTGAVLPIESATGAIEALTRIVTDLKTEAETMKQQRDAANAAAEAAAKRAQETIESLNQNVEVIRGQSNQALAQVDAVTQTKDQQIAELNARLDEAAKAAQEQSARDQVQIADLGAQVKKSQEQIRILTDRLRGLRQDPTQAVIRQADGIISRIAGNNAVYINLGAGDQITPGLTFSVYDKVTGIPAAGDPTTDANLPEGKASIEVIRVGQNSSECRIISQKRGEVLSEGDLIVNLVYDRNVKFNFLVFGNFDLDQNGVATAGDAEVVKRLITQWGGRVVDTLDVNTDFLVLGAEPVVPPFSREELEDPINKAKYDSAIAEEQAYQDLRTQARDFYIPILNQNRFLHLIGFYDQARK